MMEEATEVKTSINYAYWMIDEGNLQTCLTCPLEGCFADNDNDYTESDCPINQIPKMSRDEKNKQQANKFRRARAEKLKVIEDIVAKDGPLTALEISQRSGLTKNALWDWNRIGLFQTTPMPKNYPGNRKAKFLITGINWDHEKQRIE